MSLGKRPLLSRSGVLCHFENGEKQRRGANLSTNRRVSQCSLICLVAANEIIATGPATVISSACLLSPNLSRSPSLLAAYPTEEERRWGKEGKVERTERLPGGIGRKIAGKLVSRISFWALLADDGRQWPILRRLTTDTSYEPENRVMVLAERKISMIVGRCKWNSFRNEEHRSKERMILGQIFIIRG